MSQQYDNSNRGALFVNDRKQSDKHPDMQGKINVDGVDYYLSGWWKQTAKGEILSLALGKRVDEHPTQQTQTSRGRGRPAAMQEPRFEDIDDDIPF